MESNLDDVRATALSSSRREGTRRSFCGERTGARGPEREDQNGSGDTRAGPSKKEDASDTAELKEILAQVEKCLCGASSERAPF